MSTVETTKSKTISGLIWQYAEKCGAEIIQFIVSIIIARILSPSDYGLIGLITVFIAVANVFVSSGLGQALVQRKEIDNKDYSTVFFYSIAFSVPIYLILFLCAPYIAGFYESPQLVSIVRVLGVTVIIGAVNGVQRAYVQKTMQFKRFFVSTLLGKIISAIVGISLAYAGYGVWALVGQQISMTATDTIVLWITVKWRPQLVFSVRRMKEMFSYGWKLLCSSLIDTVYSNIYSLVIGKTYSTSDLGFYNRGKQFPMLIINNINASIQSVLFPVLSEAQEEKARLKSMVRRSIVTGTFLIFPAMAGFAAIAEPLTVTLLTDKWLPAVPFIQFCCFSYAFWPIHTANLQAINAVGRSDITLKLEVIKKVIGVGVLVLTVPHGLKVMMIARCGVAIISIFINAYPNKKLLGYSYFEQIKDMAPSLIISLVMMGVILLLTLLPISPILQMIIQVIFGIAVYFGLAKLFKLECLDYVLNTIKGFIKKKGN